MAATDDTVSCHAESWQQVGDGGIPRKTGVLRTASPQRSCPCQTTPPTPTPRAGLMAPQCRSNQPPQDMSTLTHQAQACCPLPSPLPPSLDGAPLRVWEATPACPFQSLTAVHAEVAL